MLSSHSKLKGYWEAVFFWILQGVSDGTGIGPGWHTAPNKGYIGRIYVYFRTQKPTKWIVLYS